MSIESSPAPVTAETPMRAIGDVPAEAFRRVLDGAGSPIVAEAAECWAACRGYSALALVQAGRESGYGTAANAGATRNPLGLMVRGSVPSRLQSFGSWAEAFAEFRRRVADPAPPYDPEEISLRAYLLVYVGGPECRRTRGRVCANGETAASIAAYTGATVANLNALLAESAGRRVGETAGGRDGEPAASPSGRLAASPPSPPPAAVVLGRVPRPAALVERIIPPEVNSAWDDLGPRLPRGIVLHRMLGSLEGTDGYFRGEARFRARADFGIGAGRIYQWTPLEGRVAPWASGPADGVKGEGLPFVRRYGVAAVNRDCASVEIAGDYDDPIPDADWERLVELLAWLADGWLGVAWDAWPRNRDGLVCLLGHSEITSAKPCPGPVVYGLVPQLIEDVRGRLRRYQSGATAPQPQPRFPGLPIPDDVFLAIFPTADPNGPRTRHYLGNWASKGEFPTMLGEKVGSDGAQYTWFSDGRVLRFKAGTLEEV